MPPFTQALVHLDKKEAFCLRKIFMDLLNNYSKLEVRLLEVHPVQCPCTISFQGIIRGISKLDGKDKLDMMYT